MIWINFAFWTLAMMWSINHGDAWGMLLCVTGFVFMQFMIEERDGDDGNQY